MPTTALKHLAAKADVPLDRAERLWAKAKAIVTKEYGAEHKGFYALTMGVTKRMLGLGEALSFKEYLLVEALKDNVDEMGPFGRTVRVTSGATDRGLRGLVGKVLRTNGTHYYVEFENGETHWVLASNLEMRRFKSRLEERIEPAEADPAEATIGWWIVREKDGKGAWGPFKGREAATRELRNHPEHRTHGVPADRVVYIKHGWVDDDHFFHEMDLD